MIDSDEYSQPDQEYDDYRFMNIMTNYILDEFTNTHVSFCSAYTRTAWDIARNIDRRIQFESMPVETILGYTADVAYHLGYDLWLDRSREIDPTDCAVLRAAVIICRGNF